MIENLSPMCGKLCSALLLEHFGPIVQKVGHDLFRNGEKSLNLIRSTTNLPLAKVNKNSFTHIFLRFRVGSYKYVNLKHFILMFEVTFQFLYNIYYFQCKMA